MAPPQTVARRLWINLALAAVVAALALAAYFRPGTAPQETFRLSVSVPGQIRRITIAKPGHALVVLEKQTGQWRIVQPFEARAGEPQVRRLLEILAAASTQRLPAEQLSRFELDKPLLRLTLDGQEFAFGAQHPLQPEQYVATQGWVYLIPTRFFAAAAQPADMLKADAGQ